MITFCTPPAIVSSIRYPTGPSHVQSGSVVLHNGVSFEIAGDGGPQSDFVQKLRKTDRIEVCFGPTRKWADEGLNVRPALVVNDETKDFIFTFGEPPLKPRR